MFSVASRRWSLAPLMMGAVACTGPNKHATADPLEAILAATDHHLEQHPNRDCRVDWRPDALAVAEAAERPAGESVVRTARSYVGMAYDYGGVGVDGIDCSAFVNRVFAAHGYDLPRNSRAQFRVGVKVPRAELRLGDLVFFTKGTGGSRINHVGIYLGDGHFIHASSGREEVVIDPLSVPYYRDRWAGARRITAMPPGRYSASNGGAPEGMLFASEAEARVRFVGREAPCRETEYGALTVTTP